MIFHNTPWDSGKSLGRAYNQFMEMLPSDDDFACFKDGDAMFTTDFFGQHLELVTVDNPGCGIFTAVASRIGCLWQRSGDWDSDDIRKHRAIGMSHWEQHYTATETPPPKGDLLGGVLIMIKKSVWKKIGRFSEKGILGVDNDIHLKAIAAGEPVLVMKGIYLYHWYRGGDMRNKKHLVL